MERARKMGEKTMKTIDVVPHAKLLGLNISCDPKWNVHISETVRKVSSRLYCQRQLKRAKIATKELITFYKTLIRPVSEYACQVYHNSLPKYLSDDLERLQSELCASSFLRKHTQLPWNRPVWQRCTTDTRH